MTGYCDTRPEAVAITGETSVIDVRDTASVLSMLGIVQPIWSPWAILAVCFQDDLPDSQLTPIAHFEKVFMKTGVGTMNVVDCFKDMSHGKLELSGSKVFGWFRLSTKRSDWSFPNGADAWKFLQTAQTTATNAGVPLSDFKGVCVVAPGSTYSCGWTGLMAALLDDAGAYPSIAGQEMGHGYGLDHARLEGDQVLRQVGGPPYTPDYQDPWDLMSTRVWEENIARNADDLRIGPGLNACNMRSRRWLNEARVWGPMIPTARWEETVTIRPLHHPEEPGWLAAELGPYLVELRVQEKWDAAIDRAGVLIHRLDKNTNRSYLQKTRSNDADVRDLQKGDRFVAPTHTGHYELEVEELDARNKSATIRLIARPYSVRDASISQLISMEALIGDIAGGLAGSRRDALVLGDRVVSVPSRGPVRNLVEMLAAYLDTEIGSDAAGALSSRRTLLTEIALLVAELYRESEAQTEPPPGLYD